MLHDLALRMSLLAIATGIAHQEQGKRTADQAPQPQGAIAGLWWQDYDGDGRQDAFAIGADGAARLLRSRGDGSFEDVTLVSGLDWVAAPSFAAWHDFDRDGAPDLFVGTEAGPGLLMRNARDGTFQDVTQHVGLIHTARPLAAEWLDYDVDGLSDLAIRTDAGERLYHALPSGLFEAVDLGLESPEPLPAAEAGGSDNDVARGIFEPGRLDAFSGRLPPILARPGPTGSVPPSTIARPAANDSSATGGTDTGTTGGSYLLVSCPTTVRDLATGGCLNVSSVPTLGMLYPLSIDLNVSGAGNVGIGTTTAGEKLAVAGTVQMDGFKLLTDAAAGRVLVSDANGVGTWQSQWQLAGSTISYDTGPVTIGTTAPAGGTTLTVNGPFQPILATASADGPAVAGTANGGPNGIGLYGSTQFGTGVWGVVVGGGGPSTAAVRGTNPTGGFGGYFTGKGYFSDELGLGVAQPTAKLHIGGTPGTDGIKFPDGSLQTTATLQGPAGPQGETGPAGPEGPQGPPGPSYSAGSGLTLAGTTFSIANPLALSGSDPTGVVAVTNANGTQDAAAIVGRSTYGGSLSKNIGVLGESTTNFLARGVVGRTPGAGAGWGVYGESAGGSGIGVSGVATAAAGITKGVFGQSQSPNGIGVHGYCTDATGINYAVRGQTLSPNGYAGYFDGRGYFSGSLGIGVDQPTAKLHIGGTPGTDGIRFPDGTLQTTAPAPTIDQWVNEAGDTMTSTLTLNPGVDQALDVVAGSIYMSGQLFIHDRGTGSTACGVDALRDVTTGIYNTASGYHALDSNTIGSYNTAIGYSALSSNVGGSTNTATGVSALSTNLGHDNTASGYRALVLNGSGLGNTAFGAQALESSSGNYNIGLGKGAGNLLTSGSYNIAIGHPGSAGEGATIRIGQGQLRTFIAGIRGVTTGFANAIPVVVDTAGQLGTISSSRRFKRDIADMGDATKRLLELRPVRFRYKQEQAMPDGSEVPLEYGLIAEEVAEILPDLVVYDDEGKPFTVKYHVLSSMLLNEMKKQARELEEQRKELSRLRGLEARLVAVELWASGVPGPAAIPGGGE